MRYSKGLSVLIAGALVVVSLSACGSSGSGSSGGGSGGTLKIKEGAIGGDISFEMQAVADNLGFFKKQGLEPEEITTASGVTATQALLSGDLNVVDAGGAEILSAIAAGAKLQILAPDLNIFPYYLISSKDIKTVQQVKGKSVAISKPGSSSYVGAIAGLQALGLSTSDYKFQGVGGESARLAAVAKGAVAATVVGAQLLPKIQEAGLNVLSNMADQGILFAQDYLVTTQAFTKAHPDFVKKYRAGLTEARDYLFDPANAAKVKKAIGDIFQTAADSAEVKAAYDYTIKQENVKSQGVYVIFPPGLPLSKGVFENTLKLANVKGANKIKLSDIAAPGVPISD